MPLGTLKERWKRSPLLFGGYGGAFQCVVDTPSGFVIDEVLVDHGSGQGSLFVISAAGVSRPPSWYR